MTPLPHCLTRSLPTPPPPFVPPPRPYQAATCTLTHSQTRRCTDATQQELASRPIRINSKPSKKVLLLMPAPRRHTTARAQHDQRPFNTLTRAQAGLQRRDRDQEGIERERERMRCGEEEEEEETRERGRGLKQREQLREGRGRTRDGERKTRAAEVVVLR